MEWRSGILGNIIAKYMEISKLQRKNIKWVDYLDI